MGKPSEKNMNLLVITQKMDRKDSTLGTYHAWVEEFAKHANTITVVCLEEGDHSLPSNVKVLSLGKETHRSRLQYLYRFYRYIWQERMNYDSVFVHMNDEYVLLAGLWWRLVGKKIGLFRNHIHGTWKTPIAVMFSNIVFCTSLNSYTAKFKKTKIVPAGINVGKFKITGESKRIPNSILSIGRVDPVKNIDLLIKALSLLDADGISFKANIVGDPSRGNEVYYEEVRAMALSLENKGKVEFHPAVPNPETPKFYHSHEICVNLTNSGSLDKTIFSTMASGAIPVVSNTSFAEVLPVGLLFNEGDEIDLAEKIKNTLMMNELDKKDLVSKLKIYVESHSLEKTIEIIFKSLI